MSLDDILQRAVQRTRHQATYRIAIDAQGGDVVNGETACQRHVQAAKIAAPLFPNCEFFLFGSQEEITKAMAGYKPTNVTPVDPVKEAKDETARTKIAKHIEQRGMILPLAKRLKDGEFEGIYTIENTRRVVPAVSKVIGVMDEYKALFPDEKLLPLLGELPKSPKVKRNHTFYLIDAGSIPQLTRREQFWLYAQLGMIYARTVGGIHEPTVGLLNIGKEENKGKPLLIEAHKYLKEKLGEQFVGNIESHVAVYDQEKGTSEQRPVNVVVAEGGDGNGLIKGMVTGGNLTKDFIEDEVRTNGRLYEKIAAWVLSWKGGVFDRVKKRMDPSQYGGAAFICLNKPVFKNHGTATTEGLVEGYKKLIAYIQQRATENIRQAFFTEIKRRDAA